MSEFARLPARAQAPLPDQPFDDWTLPDGTRWTEFYRTQSGYLLRFPELADFQVSADGLHASCCPAPDVTEETARHLYLNQVLPLMLARQGKLVFHASAVEIGNCAVAFMGESGRGKSTLAASFATSGFRFLTDDALLLDACDEGYRVLPSHASIRLWDDSEEALLGASARKAPPVQFTPKARVLAGHDIVFCDRPRTLNRIYFLGEGSSSQPLFERMKPADALIELVKNSFLLDTEARDLLAAHFAELSRLVEQPIYFRLDYPRHFDALANVQQAIVAHAMNEARSA